MKTVKKNEKVKRVPDKAATKMVKDEGWKYCPKSEYKNRAKEEEQSEKAKND